MNMPGTFRRQQWKMLLATMFCYLFFYTGRHNFGWAAKGMAADLHVSFSMIGWISFAMLMGYSIGQLVNGNLADRYSARTMILLGAVLSVAANFAISFSHSYIVILILWAFNGYFQAMAWAPGARIITNWWGADERGKAFGFYTMAAGASSVVTFLLSILIIQQDSSWHYIFRIPVLFLLAATFIFYFVVRNKPSDAGQPDLFNDFEKEARPNWKERYKVVLNNRRFMIASAGLGFEAMARYGLIIWVPVHFLGSDWKNNSHYLWLTLLMPAGMSCGALLFGAVSDRFFDRNRLISIRIGMFISAALALLIYLVSIDNLLITGILMFSVGFFVYGPQANFWAMCPELVGEKYVGTSIGIMNMFAYLFAALGEPLMGFVIDRTKTTSSVFIVVMIISLLCVGVTSLIDTRKKIPGENLVTA